MIKLAKKLLIILVVTAILGLPLAGTAAASGSGSLQEKETTGAAMIADLVLLRPLGFAATAVGCVFFVLSSPFSSAGGNIDQANEKLVKEPAAYTFQRPLGEFD